VSDNDRISGDKKNDHSALFSRNRCHLEDFMSLGVNDSVVLLIPTADTHHKYHECFENLSPPVVCFGDGSSTSVNSMSYLFDNCTIANTPYNDRIKNGISISELYDGLGRHNFGAIITIGSSINSKKSYNVCNKSFAVLVTWSEILNGRHYGMQVWATLNPLREVKKMFLNYRRDETKLLGLLAIEYGLNLQTFPQNSGLSD
jgi:hypothetical protein